MTSSFYGTKKEPQYYPGTKREDFEKAIAHIKPELTVWHGILKGATEYLAAIDSQKFPCEYNTENEKYLLTPDFGGEAISMVLTDSALLSEFAVFAAAWEQGLLDKVYQDLFTRALTATVFNPARLAKGHASTICVMAYPECLGKDELEDFQVASLGSTFLYKDNACATVRPFVNHEGMLQYKTLELNINKVLAFGYVTGIMAEAVKQFSSTFPSRAILSHGWLESIFKGLGFSNLEKYFENMVSISGLDTYHNEDVQEAILQGAIGKTISSIATDTATAVAYFLSSDFMDRWFKPKNMRQPFVYLVERATEKIKDIDQAQQAKELAKGVGKHIADVRKGIEEAKEETRLLSKEQREKIAKEAVETALERSNKAVALAAANPAK